MRYDGRIILAAHRGDRKHYPENTMPAFEAALRMGADMIETDVHMTRDGELIIMHDRNPLRTTGHDGWTNEMTLEEIKQLNPCHADKFADLFDGQVEVPTLYELLKLREQLRPDLKLGVEIKEYTEETVDITVKALKEYGVFEACWFYAFNGRILRYIKETYNGRTMGYPDFQMQEFDGYDAYDEIGLSLAIARSEVADVYIAKGLPVHMYCADTEEDVQFCIEKGASLITANYPGPLLNMLKPND